MRISKNFDLREFVSESIWKRFGKSATWFISKDVVSLAQFYKDFFTRYFKNKLEKKVKSVIIVINNWHYVKGGHQQRGFRPPGSNTGASLSQHRLCNAFDCDIIIIYEDGIREEASYKEIHEVIYKYEDMFMEAGLTTVESVEDAPTWLHSDLRWIPNQKEILTVRYRK